jgi:hypothetical protein
MLFARGDDGMQAQKHNHENQEKDSKSDEPLSHKKLL